MPDEPQLPQRAYRSNVNVHTPFPSPPSEAQYGAPQEPNDEDQLGEPTPTDQATPTPLPDATPGQTVPADTVILVQWAPRDIQRLRPRWSLERCRGWMMASTPYLQRELRDRTDRWMEHALQNTAPRLNMDQDERPQTATAPGLRVALESGEIRIEALQRYGLSGATLRHRSTPTPEGG